MSPDDLADCLALSAAAGWNQLEESWRRVRELEPEGCFVFEADGRVVATTTVCSFGRELAWIGMVLTLPEYRRRGIARRLMAHALDYCDRQGFACLKLDATDFGRPLYLDCGFVDERPIGRWSAELPAPRAEVANRPESATLEAVAVLDRDAFGTDRMRLLRSFDDPFVLPEGAGVIAMQPGARAWQLGPCVANDASAAERLVRMALASAGPGLVFWDILPANEAAVRLAESLGFEPDRRLVRMSRPPTTLGDPSLIWATAGFEYG